MALKLPYGCFVAKILKGKKVSDFTITEAVYPPDTKLPKHSHERACFSLVLNGCFTEKYRNKTRHCEPAKVIYLPPYETHSENFLKTGGRGLHVEVDARWQMRFGESAMLLAYSTDFQGGAIASLFYKLYQEFKATDAATALAIEGLMLEIIAESWRDSTRSPTKKNRLQDLERVRDFLHAHFAEQNSLASIAELAEMRPAHLARAFRGHYGCTVGEYVRRLRVEFACRELFASDKPLALIAQNAGFFDQSHFSKTFKLLTGKSPAAYRKLLDAN